MRTHCGKFLEGQKPVVLTVLTVLTRPTVLTVLTRSKPATLCKNRKRECGIDVEIGRIKREEAELTWRSGERGEQVETDRLSVAGCPSWAVRRRPSVVGRPSSVVRCWSSVVGCPLSAVRRRLSVVVCRLSVVVCRLSVVLREAQPMRFSATFITH